MSLPTEHLDDDVLSALLDSSAPEHARSHVATCAECEQRLEELRGVVGLLRSLPNLPIPRQFAIVEAPNVVRLERWYTWTRVAAGAVAAVFVFMVAGTLYIDSSAPTSAPAVREAAAPAKPAVVASSAPAAPQLAPPGPAAAARPAPAPTQAASAGAAVRSQPPEAPAPDASDQVAAATTVRALPTPLPTPTAVPLPPVASPAPRVEPADPAAPWRVVAAISGVLSVLLLFIAIVLRHRLRARAIFATE